MSTNLSSQASALERDPVCGMNVNPATAKYVYSLAGKNYYFCCAACVEKFKADPARYLQPTLPPKSSGLITLGAAKPAAPSAHEAAH
ncbi:MAG: YHS domain-containing protein, partial [Candidatus Sulfotelmatobacter sp.]